jgi:hypothetical protein
MIKHPGSKYSVVSSCLHHLLYGPGKSIVLCLL